MKQNQKNEWLTATSIALYLKHCLHYMVPTLIKVLFQMLDSLSFISSVLQPVDKVLVKKLWKHSFF